jgi:hypothetical protein
MRAAKLTKSDIDRLFRELDAHLKELQAKAELYLVGGAVMCLVHAARASTRDVDALFKPSKTVRIAAARVAAENGLPETWLNDAVKGYFSVRGSFSVYLELEHLTVYAADPGYLLAMKCLSARIGEEFHDVEDIRYLLRYLNLTEPGEAKELIAAYYPLERFPQKTLYLLEGLLSANDAPR